MLTEIPSYCHGEKLSHRNFHLQRWISFLAPYTYIKRTQLDAEPQNVLTGGVFITTLIFFFPLQMNRRAKTPHEYHQRLGRSFLHASIQRSMNRGRRFALISVANQLWPINSSIANTKDPSIAAFL